MKNTMQRYCFFAYPPNIWRKKYVLQHVFLCFDKSIWQKYTNFHFFSPKIWSIQIKAVPLHPVSKTKLVWNKIGAVVQLVRIHACHAWGRGFESRPHRKEEAKMLLLSFSTEQSTEFISFLFFFLHICKKSSNFVRFLAFYVLYTWSPLEHWNF